MAVADQEKSEMFVLLLKDTMKNQKKESSKISEHSENIEDETKEIIETNGHNEQLGIVVTRKKLGEILKR